MERWEVAYVHEFNFMDPSLEGTTHHRSYVGADWHRRFRYRHFGMGSCRVITLITRTADNVAWDTFEQAKPPRYALAFHRVVWPVVYFLRSRWDGLRYGRDRDRR